MEQRYFPNSSNRNHYISDFYVRDAQGNIMATYKYEFDFANSVNRFDLEEFHMYGSSRIGTIQLGFPLYENGSPNPNWTEPITNLRVGHKRYELTNHGSATLTTGLGNVMAVVNDRTQGVHADADGIIDYYEATVLKANDYYPFGSLMPGREYSAGDYRFGFNGMEKDDEVSGEGNSLDFGARVYDSRLGRWLSVDPAFLNYSSLSPYAYTANNPIWFYEVDGEVFDFSNLTKEQKAQFETQIGRLNMNRLFRTYYRRLQLSETVYKLNVGPGAGGEGSFYPGTNNVFFNLDQLFVIAQELFHAYQFDLGVYNDNDYSVIETEGDLVTGSITNNLGVMGPGFLWDNEILFNDEFVDKDLAFDSGVFSDEFNIVFSAAVDTRIKYYKDRESELSVKAPITYISDNSGKGPLALQKAVREQEAENFSGPRLENGDYYAE